MIEFFRARRRLTRVRLLRIFVVFLSVAAVGRADAAAAAESRDYEVAVRFFNSGAYDLAEKELAGFVRNHPESARIQEVVLLQAQSRFQLKQFDAAEALLRERLNSAGSLGDQYRYWIGECLYQRGSFGEAAATFAQVVSDFPASPRRLEASLGEAFSRFKLGELGPVIDLLTRTNGVFQQAAPGRLNEEPVVRGFLLLGETYLRAKEYRAGEDALNRLADANLRPDLSWQRQILLARLQRADQRQDAALQTATNLLAQLGAVTNAASAGIRAEAVTLQGEILEAKNQPDAAVRAYEENLAPTVPAELRQQALQQIVRLTLAQNRVGEAGLRLEAFVTQYPADPALDLLRLTLGELRLKEYYGLSADAKKGGTNLLQLAHSHFGQVIANTNSPLEARAQYGRGWCFWEQDASEGGTNSLGQGLAAFQSAAEKLPRAEQQAVARFKLADCQLIAGNPAGAITNYWRVVADYPDLPRVTNELGGLALYQIVRAGVQAGDMPSAERALKRILDDYPASPLTERSELLFGQAVNRLGEPERARSLFRDFEKQFPGSQLLPEVALAGARTYEQEGNWPEAMRQYDQWTGTHTNHAARPEAEFSRAWAHYRGGDETNAFALFTNFVAQFRTSALAPEAQFWVADYHYRQGDYAAADLNYQKVYQNTNWPVSSLSFQARMMAGRAAYRRQGYADARGYFLWMITNGPPELRPEALFALSDTFISASVAGASSLTNYIEAIDVLDKITQAYPTNRLVPLAWGRMGDCYLQLATEDPKLYDRALNAYTNVLRPEHSADVAARSRAEVGIATVLEKQARLAPATERSSLLNGSLGHCLNVVKGKVLREGETADPFWMKQAAESAARLAEELQRWEVAADLYRQLLEIAPPLRKLYESKLEKIELARPKSESNGK